MSDTLSKLSDERVRELQQIFYGLDEKGNPDPPEPLRKVLEAIEQRGGRYEVQHDEWKPEIPRRFKFKATCPLSERHRNGDEHPSMSVTWSPEKEAVGIKCWVCGNEAFADIVTALGLEQKDLFLSKPERRKIVAIYDYRDEEDNLLYQNVRYEPKDFRQRRPNGNGGWIWKLNGVRRVL